MFFAASPAVAQSSGDDVAPDGREYAQSSERVRKLNDEGVGAIINEDYTRAVALLEESKSIQESNIVYLNLGRAYQKLGKCEPARRALEAVSEAPVVRDPPPDIVDKKAMEYLGELDEMCPKEGGSGMAAADAAAGDAQTGQSDGGEGSVAEDQSASSQPKTKRRVDQLGGADLGVSDSDPASSRSAIGWVGLGTGVALIGTGVWLHFDAESRRDGIGGDDGSPASVSYSEAQDIEQTANTLDTVGLGLAVVGAVAGGFGTYFLLTDAPAETDTSQVSVSPNRGGASVTFSTQW